MTVCVVLAHTARNAKRRNDELLGQCAALEHRLDDMTAKYDNEVKHRQWATSMLKERTNELNTLRNEQGTGHTKGRR